MVISSCQMIGYFAGIGTLVGSIVATSLSDWKHTNSNDQAFGAIIQMQGLWTKCYVKPAGYECTALDGPFFALASVLRGCRVLAVMASVLAFIGVATTPLGMQCTRIGGDRITKARLARFGAFLFGLSGILIGAAVSWFSNDIAKDYKEVVIPGIYDNLTRLKHTYGNALFVGWATMVLGVISFIFLSMGSCEQRVGPRISTASVSSNSSRALTATTNGKERLRPITPLKRLNKAPNPKTGEYYSTAVTNGSAGGQATITLAAPYYPRTGLQRQASTLSAPAKTVGQTGQEKLFKTYV